MKRQIGILLCCVATTISLAGCAGSVGTKATGKPALSSSTHVLKSTETTYLYKSDTDNTTITKGVMDLTQQTWNFAHKKEPYKQVVTAGENDLSQAQAALADSKKLVVPDQAEYRQYQANNLTFESEDVSVIQDLMDALKHGDFSQINAANSEMNQATVLQQSLLKQHRELLTEVGK